MEVVSAGQDEDLAVANESSDIVKCAEEAQVQASAELLRNLRLMVNAPGFSDVVFLCSDGKRVQASRIVLAGRSEVLKSMFMNGMAESGLSEIKMPEITSPVLLAVFEFLYTGTLLDYQPQGWRIACEVIVASRFFLLPNLEMITRKFMHSLASAVVEELPKAAIMLTQAVAMKSLCDEPDVNLRELVTILSSDWSDSVHVNGLSENAFNYLLENSGGNYEDDGKLSFREYLRFRQVVQWWVSLSDFESRVEEALLTVIAPDEEEALCLCRDPDNFEIEDFPEDITRLVHDWRSGPVDEVARKSVMRLMSNIDCRCIHPALLAKVVEPLNIVSAAEILDSFRFHALRRPMIFTIPECVWDFGESYCTFESQFVVQKTKDRVGLAVMKAPMSRSYGVHQWRFVVEEWPKRSFEMGFTSYANGEPEFDDERLSDQDDASVVRIAGKQTSVGTKGTDGSIVWKVLEVCASPVVFNYNAVEHTCSLTIDGHDYGKCWEHLPNEVYYPAVYLGSKAGGRVRIELVSGFDIV